MDIPTVEAIKERINSVEDESVRLGLEFTYLSASNPAEVFGDKHITINDVIEYEDRVLFKLKTIRYNGNPRPVLLPKTGTVLKILDFLNENESFLLHQNVYTSKTYAMKYGRNLFDGLCWASVNYDEVFKHEHWSKYLKEIGRPENQTKFNYPIKWRAFTLSSLRKLRERELLTSYDFNRVEYEAFTAQCEDDDNEWLYEIGMIYYDKLSSR